MATTFKLTLSFIREAIKEEGLSSEVLLLLTVSLRSLSSQLRGRGSAAISCGDSGITVVLLTSDK